MHYWSVIKSPVSDDGFKMIQSRIFLDYAIGAYPIRMRDFDTCFPGFLQKLSELNLSILFDFQNCVYFWNFGLHSIRSINEVHLLFCAHCELLYCSYKVRVINLNWINRAWVFDYCNVIGAVHSSICYTILIMRIHRSYFENNLYGAPKESIRIAGSPWVFFKNHQLLLKNLTCYLINIKLSNKSKVSTGVTKTV